MYTLLVRLASTLTLFISTLIYRDASFLLEVTLFRNISTEIQLTLFFDWLALIFIITVIVISSAIIKFSHSYIAEEFFSVRFTWLVVRFIISILLLITSLNLIRLLLGWDGLGITSFILVVYFNRDSSNRAGLLTALRNRLGDRAILISIAILARVGS